MISSSYSMFDIPLRECRAQLRNKPSVISDVGLVEHVIFLRCRRVA